jgi:hypothetical protein
MKKLRTECIVRKPPHSASVCLLRSDRKFTLGQPRCRANRGAGLVRYTVDLDVCISCAAMRMKRGFGEFNGANTHPLGHDFTHASVCAS